MKTHRLPILIKLIEPLGGASVNYHILSAESRNYFRNAICMSGSVGNPWAFPSECDHVNNAYEIAEKLGNPQNSYDELVTFLKTTPAEALNQFSTTVAPNAVQISIVFGPTIESNFDANIFETNFIQISNIVFKLLIGKDAENPFLVESPKEIYESSTINVNTMFTIASKVEFK